MVSMRPTPCRPQGILTGQILLFISPQIIFSAEERDCVQLLECNQEPICAALEDRLIQGCDSPASEFPCAEEGLARPSPTWWVD